METRLTSTAFVQRLNQPFFTLYLSPLPSPLEKCPPSHGNLQVLAPCKGNPQNRKLFPRQSDITRNDWDMRRTQRIKHICFSTCFKRRRVLGLLYPETHGPPQVTAFSTLAITHWCAAHWGTQISYLSVLWAGRLVWPTVGQNHGLGAFWELHWSFLHFYLSNGGVPIMAPSFCL